MANKILFKKDFFDFWFIIGKHRRFYSPLDTFVCDCNYCDKIRSWPSFSFGMIIPENKVRNAWWVIYFKGEDFNYYLKFTLPFLKKQ